MEPEDDDQAEDRPDPDDPIPGTGDPLATGPKGGGEWPEPPTPPAGVQEVYDSQQADVGSISDADRES